MNPLLTLMHDTAHDLCSMDANLWIIKNKLKNNKLSNEELIERIDKIWQHKKDLVTKLDQYYIQQKQLEKL